MGADGTNESLVVPPTANDDAMLPSRPLMGSNKLELPTGIDLRNVLDGMSEGFALLGPDFTLLDLNAEAMRLEARTRDEIIGRSHWDVYPGSEDGPLGPLYKKAMCKRVAVNLEHQHIWADGRVSWLDMRAYPTADGNLAVFFRDVTERKTAELSACESAQRFEGAVSAVADVLWTNDAEGRMTGEQPGWAALTGQSFNDYQNFGWSKAVHPDDVQPTLDAWQNSLRERQLFAFEHRVRRHDGEWRHFAIRAVPVLTDKGMVREWVGVHRDITDRHRSEARQALFLEFADKVHDLTGSREIICVATELLAKQLATNRVGYGEFNDDASIVAFITDYADDVEHLNGEYPTAAFGHGNIADLRRGVTTVYDDVTLDPRTKESVFVEIDTRAAVGVPLIRDGRLRAVLYVNHRTPRVWRPDEVLLVQEVAARTWDALDRARAEAELRESETRFRQLADNVNALFYVHEAEDERVSYVNPQYERIWQQPASAVYADMRTFMRDIHEDDRPAVEAASRRQLAGENTETRYRLVRSDGTVCHIHDRSFVTTNPDGGALRVVGLAEDVTEQMVLQTSLHQALADKDMLLREIDHRVRNSLSMVAALLSMQGASSDNLEVKQALIVAASRMQAVARVHERLYKGKQLGIVEFGTYLKEICRDLCTSLRHDRTELAVTTVPVDLPVDQAVPLGLVVNELVTNAFKHAGGGSATISVDLASDAETLILTVSDTGLGMAEDFNASHRKGLGMQVIDLLTRQLGGTLTLPAAGSAAVFVVKIPV